MSENFSKLQAYPGRSVASVEADAMAANELATHAILQVPFFLFATFILRNLEMCVLNKFCKRNEKLLT